MEAPSFVPLSIRLQTRSLAWGVMRGPRSAPGWSPIEQAEGSKVGINKKFSEISLNDKWSLREAAVEVYRTAPLGKANARSKKLVPGKQSLVTWQVTGYLH